MIIKTLRREKLLLSDFCHYDLDGVDNEDLHDDHDHDNDDTERV